jgi:predicted glutamine amidotransferase
MCRMGFVSTTSIVDQTKTIRDASNFYSDENPDGFGFAYLHQGRIIYYSKTKESAKQYWMRNPQTRILSHLSLFHDRRASIGSISSSNSHPFVSNQVALAHNGTLHNYEKLRNHLIEKRFNFTSQTDSEILLALWIFYKAKFISKLTEWNVDGKITTIILTLDGLYLYTNNNAMVIYKTKNALMGFSDTRFMGSENAVQIHNKVLYFISGNNIIPMTQNSNTF